MNIDFVVDKLIDAAPARRERMQRAMENIGLNTPEAVDAVLRSMEREREDTE